MEEQLLPETKRNRKETLNGVPFFRRKPPLGLRSRSAKSTVRFGRERRGERRQENEKPLRFYSSPKETVFVVTVCSTEQKNWEIIVFSFLTFALAKFTLF